MKCFQLLYFSLHLLSAFARMELNKNRGDLLTTSLKWWGVFFFSRAVELSKKTK